MNTLNALLRNATLAEVEASLALMIENRTFSEQGNRMLGILNDTISKYQQKFSKSKDFE